MYIKTFKLRKITNSNGSLIPVDLKSFKNLKFGDCSFYMGKK